MKRYLLLTLLTVAAGTAVLFAQYGACFFWADFSQQQVPFVMETKRMLASGTPFWSWNTYYGQNFWGSYTFYTLTSPFVWLDCLFPYRWMLEVISVTLALKYACAFAAARHYFRVMGVSRGSASIGGLLYAFSSYAIVTTAYYHFLEPVIAFPLLLSAVERFVRGGRYGATALAAAVGGTVIVNYYFAIGSLVMASVYTFFRLMPRLGGRWPGAGRVAAGIGCAALGVLLPTAAALHGGAREATYLTGLDSTAWGYAVERLPPLPPRRRAAAGRPGNVARAPACWPSRCGSAAASLPTRSRARRS